MLVHSLSTWMPLPDKVLRLRMNDSVVVSTVTKELCKNNSPTAVACHVSHFPLPPLPPGSSHGSHHLLFSGYGVLDASLI